MRINCYNNADWPNEKKDEIDSFFNTITLTDTNSINKFKQLYKIISSNDYNKNDIEINQPIVCNDMFCCFKPAFWISNDMKIILNKIKKLNYIFLYKWSFSTILSLLTMINDKNTISRCIFRMSNSSLRGISSNESETHKIPLPINYSLSGCITSAP